MKIYPYIVINKDNMKSLEHFKTSQQVADRVTMGNGSLLCSQVFRHFIVIKNETKIVDWSKMDGIGGDFIYIYRAIQKVIEET